MVSKKPRYEISLQNFSTAMKSNVRIRKTRHKKTRRNEFKNKRAGAEIRTRVGGSTVP